MEGTLSAKISYEWPASLSAPVRPFDQLFDLPELDPIDSMDPLEDESLAFGSVHFPAMEMLRTDATSKTLGSGRPEDSSGFSIPEIHRESLNFTSAEEESYESPYSSCFSEASKSVRLPVFISCLRTISLTALQIIPEHYGGIHPQLDVHSG